MRKLLLVPGPLSSVRHRLLKVLKPYKHWADDRFQITLVWPVTRNVGFCLFEDLFSPIPGVKVVNLRTDEAEAIWHDIELKRPVVFQDHAYSIGLETDSERIVGIDCEAFTQAFCIEARPLNLRPNENGREYIEILTKKHRLAETLGIRIRTGNSGPNPIPDRPARTKEEMDKTIAPFLALRRTTKILLVTDSRYVQDMICPHFNPVQGAPDRPTVIVKAFDLVQNGTDFVDPKNTKATFMYMLESFCLVACKHVINVGGFLLDDTCVPIQAPYTEYLK